MRILVYPHDLEIGGSQLNAIELAAAVRDLGHEVVVFGRRGALNARIDELGLEFVDAPPPGKRPSPTTAAALRRLVRERGIDVIHGYEWPPVLDALLAAPGTGVRVMATVMSMAVAPFLPHDVPLIVGTAQIAAAERDRGRTRVAVIEPPVDLDHNRVARTPGIQAFREEFGLADDRVNVVAVTRFARELKLEGILTAIDVVGRLARRHPVRLVLVGDGPARSDVDARIAALDDDVRSAVVLTGRQDDPRPAYAVADIALGMGGSALRALAFTAPLVVQGEQGFWLELRPDTIDRFLWSGWYGVGEGAHLGQAALTDVLERLLADPAERKALADFGYAQVCERFSLTHAAHVQEDLYRRAVHTPRTTSLTAGAAALARYSGYYAGKRVRRARGVEAADDFNARPVVASSTPAEVHA